MYDSDEAATYTEGIKGWVSRRGYFFGEDENLARYDGSTHKRCDTCGEIKSLRSYCRPCQHKREQEDYAKLELKPYDGSVVYSLDQGNFYFDRQHLDDECFHLGHVPGRLVFCVPMKLRLIDESYWDDQFEEDWELPTEVKTALNALNDALSKADDYWIAGNVAAEYTWSIGDHE